MNVPVKGHSQFPDITDLNISTAGVEKQLLSLSPTKACRPDELPPRLLRTVAQELAPALIFLFNQSYTTGIVPMQWKQAIVTGIFMTGSRSDPANYKPISLTCLCCKAMEHIVPSHAAKHLSANNILLHSQHGFREKLSTVTLLMSSCHDWATAIHSRGQVDVVFFGFSKAIDKVPHRRISVKLSYYGINGSTLTWINDILRNRFQAVSVNGSHSTWSNVTSGGPQGSVLDPALFLLYICDIKGKIQSNMHLYADDTIDYRDISINDHNILQEDLDTLSEWTATLLMDFNICKCAILPINKKCNTSFLNYTIFGNILEHVDDHEYLGISISHDLYWEKHCNRIAKKASKTLGLLRRTLSPCSKEVKSSAYQALVRQQLECAAEAWSPYNLTTADRLEHIHRAAARFVHHDNQHTTSVNNLLTFWAGIVSTLGNWFLISPCLIKYTTT